MRSRILLITVLVAGAALMFAAAATHAPLAVRIAGRAMQHALALSARTAFAQEVLEFKPIPAESARALESRRARRVSVPEAAAPASPSTPVPPPAPAPPTRVELTRSGNIMRVGNDITVEADQTVVGDVLAVGGDITVEGHVEGDVVAMGGDVHLAETARVDGDVVCMGGALSEEQGAYVGGQRVTAAGRGDKRLVRRLRDRYGADVDFDEHESRRATGRLAGTFVFSLIGLGLAWAFAVIAPGRTGAAVQTMRTESGPSTLVGFLTLLLAGPSFLVIIILGALLCITIIGIPLALAAWIGYGLLLTLIWFWGWAIAAAVIGGALLRRRGQTPSLVQSALWGAGLVGILLLTARMMKLVPGFGGLGTLIAVLTWIAFGALTMVGSGAWIRNEWRQGTLARWWRGRTSGGSFTSATPPPSPPAPAPAPSAMWTPDVPSPPAGGSPGAPSPPPPPANPA